MATLTNLHAVHQNPPLNFSKISVMLIDFVTKIYYFFLVDLKCLIGSYYILLLNAVLCPEGESRISPHIR